MGWSGGNYTKGNAATGGWVGDASLGIGIEAGRHDTQDNDFATGINQCLNKDGSNAATGNLNFGGFLPTNLGAGTAAVPALCMNNDTNTGFFSPAADQIGVATNGTEKIRIDASGKLGVGTTAPSSEITISKGAGASAALSLQSNGNTSTNEFTLIQATDGTTTYLYNRANGPLILGTNNAERLRVAADGKIGISQNAPTSALHVGGGSAQTVVYIQGSTSGSGGGAALSMPQGILGNISAIDGGAYNAGLKLRSYSGGLTLTADSGGFAMTGLAGSTGGSAMKWNTSTGQWFYDTSAARYKENIRDSELGLETVKALRPRQYNYIYEGTPEDVGFIAEEVDLILPFLVAKNANNECESITYDRLTSVLVKAVQELNAKVEALEARIAALEP